MNLLSDFTDEEEDFLEMYNICLNRRKTQNYREITNHFEKWSESEFLDRFRLSKEAVRYITMKIAEVISPTSFR